MKNVCIFITLAIVPLFGQNTKSVSGTITNSSGERLSGVKVCMSSLNCVLTDVDGRYEINSLNIVSIRFSHHGYNAVTKNNLSNTSNKIDVVLQKPIKEFDNKRIIPRCSENDNLFGRIHKVMISPKDIDKVIDIDYTMMTVLSSGNKTEILRLIQGPVVSSNVPSWPVRSSQEEWSVIYDRDIVYENQRDNEPPISSSVDIKAQSSDGKFLRYIQNISEVISYFNVSEATALEFDEIMDTLCYSPLVNNP